MDLDQPNKPAKRQHGNAAYGEPSARVHGGLRQTVVVGVGVVVTVCVVVVVWIEPGQQHGTVSTNDTKDQKKHPQKSTKTATTDP